MKARILLPYLLLTILLGVGMFIAGVRQGSRVEKSNKVINFVLSIPPSQPPPTKDPEKPLEFKTLTNQYCGISFLYPATYKVSDEGNEIGIIKIADKDNKTVLSLQCVGKRLTPVLDKENVTATASITFKNKKITAEKSEANVLKFHVIHPQTGYILIITIDKKILPLFERTLEFTS